MTTVEEVPKGGGGLDLGKLEGQSPQSADDMDLIRMGKKPKMKRVYNFWTRKYRSGGLVRRFYIEYRLQHTVSVCLPGHDVCHLGV